MKRLHIFGNSSTTPGVVTAPATLRTDPLDIGDDTTGLTFNFSDSASENQVALRIIDKDGTSKVQEVYLSHIDIINRKVGAQYGVFDAFAGLNGTVAPVCIDLAGGARIWGGIGDPSSTFTGTGRLGDVFLRTDTPSTANQRYYICTSAGTPGTWTGKA